MKTLENRLNENQSPVRANAHNYVEARVSEIVGEPTIENMRKALKILNDYVENPATLVSAIQALEKHIEEERKVLASIQARIAQSRELLAKRVADLKTLPEQITLLEQRIAEERGFRREAYKLKPLDSIFVTWCQGRGIDPGEQTRKLAEMPEAERFRWWKRNIEKDFSE